MPIASSDLSTRLSGGPTNTNPAASLGGAESSTAFTDAKNQLFDDVASSEASAGDTEYRGFYIHNGHASLTWQSVVVWISALTALTGTEFDIALAAEAVNVAMATIANESTVPTGVTFSRPTTKAAGLSIGNIPAGQYKGIWLRRTVDVGAGAGSDTGSVRFEGDTA